MIRFFFRLVLLVAIVVGAAGFFLGWWSDYRWRGARDDRPAGTSGRFDPSKARAVGSEIAQKTATAASEAEAVLSDTALTAKIKSKMALDDSVRARNIEVHTTKHVVTLSGVVGSQAERKRAVQLAKETSGVNGVVDRLKVK